MDHNTHDKPEHLPDWLQKAINEMPDPPPERLAKFDYLKAGFVQAFQKAYGGGSIVDIVFSMSGRLVEVAQGIVEGLQDAFGMQPAFVPAGVRSTESAEEPKPIQTNLIAKAQKVSGNCLIEALTFRDLECTRLELNVIEKATGNLIRPFDVSVKDEQDRPVVKDIHVTKGQTGANFSGPAAGLYLFSLSWSGGQDTISIRFQQQN